jgi:septum formation inhibitor MinC
VFTETTLATRVLELLGASEQDLPLPRVVSQIPVAVDRLGERFARGELKEHVETLRQTFTVTATAGEADISALFAPAQGLVSTAVRLAKVYQPSDTQESEWEPDRLAVTVMARQGFPVVAREGNVLVFGDSTGATGTTAGDVTIKGLAIPVQADGTIDVPNPVGSALIDELAAVFAPAKVEG